MTAEGSGAGLHPNLPAPRAVLVTLDEVEVLAICAKRKFSVSAVETLLSGGTRVVLQRAEDAASLRRILRAKLIDGPISRIAWEPHRGWAERRVELSRGS